MFSLDRKNIGCPPFLSDFPSPSLFSRNHQLSPADGPKVVGKVSVAEVFVGHGEIALQAPIGSPGISDNKTLFGMIVSHGENGVSAEYLPLRFGHIHDTGPGDLLGFKALIDGKAKDKREPFGRGLPGLLLTGYLKIPSQSESPWIDPPGDPGKIRRPADGRCSLANYRWTPIYLISPHAAGSGSKTVTSPT
jgi:hypothetical protein